MKTIYNVYVPIESQEQADRMKQICIYYGLPYWDDILAFDYYGKHYNFFSQSTDNKGLFAVFWGELPKDKTQVTESEFLELVKMLNKC